MTEYSVPDYECFFKKRLNKKGGRVICYVKNKHPAMKIKKNNIDKYSTVYIELQTSKLTNLTIGTVYRPPKQQAANDAALYQEIQAMTQNKQSVIIGDFNCPTIN